jgi:hypothetical protein
VERCARKIGRWETPRSGDDIFFTKACDICRFQYLKRRIYLNSPAYPRLLTQFANVAYMTPFD